MASIEEKIGGVRIVFNQRENWYLTPNERKIMRSIIETIKDAGSYGVTITRMYESCFAKLGTTPNDAYKKMQMKCLLMLLWKKRDVRIKANNGVKVIKWRKKPDKTVSD